MAIEVQFYNEKGKEDKKVALNDDLFANVNDLVLQEYIIMYLSNRRNPIAHTKTRGEVKRSGRKLYRQKGTGNARVGDAGSPIRRHGGVAFGPRNERNYEKDMNKKSKRLALLTALFHKTTESNSMLGLSSTDTFKKTKDASILMKSLALLGDRVLFVGTKSTVDFYKTVRNIPGVDYISSEVLNPYLVTRAKKVVFVDSGLYDLIKRLEK